MVRPPYEVHEVGQHQARWPYGEVVRHGLPLMVRTPRHLQNIIVQLQHGRIRREAAPEGVRAHPQQPPPGERGRSPRGCEADWQNVARETATNIWQNVATCAHMKQTAASQATAIATDGEAAGSGRILVLSLL